MALIVCPECRREVSDKAHSCPHCGLPAPGLARNATTNEPGAVLQATGDERVSRPIPSTSRSAVEAFEIAKTWAYWAVVVGMVLGIGAGARGGGVLLGLVAGVMIAVPLAAVVFVLVWLVTKLRNGLREGLAPTIRTSK